MTYQPIESYGLIGDMRSIALVSERASIDYLCLPRFDSPTVFAALLDEAKGGRFSLAPADAEKRRVRQFYVPDTNILMTRFLSEDGVAEVIDFMPTPEPQHAHRIVRIVKGVRGRTQGNRVNRCVTGRRNSDSMTSLISGAGGWDGVVERLGRSSSVSQAF